MDDEETRQLRQLLALSQTGRLGPKDEFHLRLILGRSTPEAATMSREWLIRSGLFLLGAHEFLSFVESQHRAA